MLQYQNVLLAQTCSAGGAVSAVLRVVLFQAHYKVNPVDNADDDGLPGNQVSEPVKELSIKDVRLLPAGG